jgi:hypothetical protein
LPRYDKNVFDYVIRRFEASLARLNKPQGLNLRWDRRFTRSAGLNQAEDFFPRSVLPPTADLQLQNHDERKKYMKTLSKFIPPALVVVVVAMGAVTANGALNDLFASVNGAANNGGGFIYEYTPAGGAKHLCFGPFSPPWGGL